jgi:hypothetical protein
LETQPNQLLLFLIKRNAKNKPTATRLIEASQTTGFPFQVAVNSIVGVGLIIADVGLWVGVDVDCSNIAVAVCVVGAGVGVWVAGGVTSKINF